MVLGPVDELLHDEEVAGEAHLKDDLELVLQAVAVGLRVDVGAVGVLFQSWVPKRMRLGSSMVVWV